MVTDMIEEQEASSNGTMDAVSRLTRERAKVYELPIMHEPPRHAREE